MQADDVRDRGVMDGGASCTQRVCTRARARFLLLIARGEGCVDGRGASFAVSAVEVLKASGPQGLAMSQSPILVTYGPAMRNTLGCSRGFGFGWGVVI